MEHGNNKKTLTNAVIFGEENWQSREAIYLISDNTVVPYLLMAYHRGLKVVARRSQLRKNIRHHCTITTLTSHGSCAHVAATLRLLLGQEILLKIKPVYAST